MGPSGKQGDSTPEQSDGPARDLKYAGAKMGTPIGSPKKIVGIL